MELEKEKQRALKLPERRMHLTKSNALVKKNNSNDDDDDNDKNENVSTDDDETTLLLELTPFSQAFATVMEAFRTLPVRFQLKRTCFFEKKN